MCIRDSACAVAEWKFGAGKGTENMIFLTFGTGIGAGLILNGRLYEGSTGMAGETGHLRLFETGHIGHGKAGSFEGYVSGGGIAQYGKGTAKELGKRAAEGDPEALALWNEIGENLGKLLAILIDLFNPEAIVIGSIYARAGEYMKAGMEAVIEKMCIRDRSSTVPTPFSFARRKSSVMKSSCKSGSPPLTVIPPSFPQ